MAERLIVKIVDILGTGIYAEQTEAGGFRFYDDSCGVLSMFLDTTLLQKSYLDLVLEWEPYLNQHWDKITQRAEINDECIRLQDHEATE